MGFVELFEGDFADLCTEFILLLLMGGSEDMELEPQIIGVTSLINL
jgi:hypothetical protein